MAKPSFTGRDCVLGLILAIFALCIAQSAAANCASTTWQSTYPGLQEARAAITAQRRPAIHTRARCARQIVEAIGQPDVSCAECVLEYARLLADVTAIQRLAFNQSGADDLRKQYLESEFDIRRNLHLYLAEAAHEVALERLAKLNIADAGSCIERLAKLDPNGKRALEFHELISSVQQDGLLGPQSLRSWAKAVRSCDRWDITSGENRDNQGVLAALCAPGCQSYLHDYNNRVASALKGLPYVPRMEACGP